MPGSFFDSNVILYLTSPNELMASRAEQVLRPGGTISVQVLNECTNVLRNKNGLSWPDIRFFLSDFQQRLKVLPLTIAIHQSGLRLAERYGFSVYDSFIVAAALESGCDTLWSEDMQHGLVVDETLRIANPFAA